MNPIRRPAVAGMFYPEDPMMLTTMIEEFLKEAGDSFLSSPPFPTAIIAPHAGYSYSGAVAARAYRAVQNGPYETVVVLAPSHHHFFEGMAVSNQSLQTPLGLAETDEAAVQTFLKSGLPFTVDPSAHAREHSAEVHFPFIQTVLPKAKVVDVTIGRVSREDLHRAAEVLKKFSETKQILVVASTDLSHFHPYQEAKRIDEGTLALIGSLETETLLAAAARDEAELCGLCSVGIVLDYARLLGAKTAALLDYANSGETGGDKSRVVGYAAFRLDEGRKS